jgi:nicotinamide-nucleotide amidase
MREMLHHQTLPYLKAKFPPAPPPLSLAAHFFGVSESMIDPSLRILEEAHPDIEFGIYPSHGTLKVSATYKPSALTMSADKLAEVIAFLKQKFNSHFYGLGDESLETLIYNQFTRSGWTLSTAESCTGGSIAARLTKVAGASNYFKGGVVSYSNELKEAFLNVPKKVIDTYGAISEETVRAMAEGILRKTGTDFGLAISGVAGPTGGTEDTPVGTMWIAVTSRKKGTETHRIRGFGNREMVIETGVNVALGLLLKFAS